MHCADGLAVRALEADHAGTRLSYARAQLALEERRQSAALAVAANGGRSAAQPGACHGTAVGRHFSACPLYQHLTTRAALRFPTTGP